MEIDGIECVAMSEVRRLTQEAAIRAQSPQVTTEEAAILAGKPSEREFRKWAMGQGIRCIRRNAWSRSQIITALNKECDKAARKYK